MYVKLVSDEVQFTIYNYVRDNPSAIAREVNKGTGFSLAHTQSALLCLEESGYVYKVRGKGSIPSKWFATDKPFNYTPPPRKTHKCKTIEIEIKPDLAAMWLLKSPPRLEKRSIAIVRSIGFGVRQSTL